MSTKTQNIATSEKPRKLRLLLDAESMEPSLTWGLRMAIATTAPVVWGVATGRLEEAEWIALTADCIGWISLKGNASQRFRLLFAAAILCLFFTLIGSVSGGSVFWSVTLMVAVAFVSGLFRNLGERGSGLALCLYVMFIIANAYPVQDDALHERMVSVAVGGVWNAILGMATILFIPQQTPYRRSIALIWQKTAALIQSIAAGWNGKGIRSSVRDIYLAEQAVMDALSSSLAFYEKAIYQLGGKEHTDEYKLAQVRKAAALVASTMQTMSEELEEVQLHTLSEDARLRISGLMTSLKLNVLQMSTVSLSGRQEDELLMEQTLQQLQQRIEVLSGFEGEDNTQIAKMMANLAHLSGRCYKLLSRSVALMTGIKETSVFRSYSILKTAYVLHPKHWWRSIRILFSFDSHTTRFVVRTSLASGVAIAIDKIFDLQRGYWLPFTVIIVLQPYFIATFKKAIDRLLGTVAGGMMGGLILMIPRGLYLKEVMLFLSAIAMIHFYKKSYRVSAFFITLNLVLLFSVSQELDKNIIFWRAGLTLGGAAIAVVAGFLLFPAWDKKYLPRYVTDAVYKNWLYFKNTFFSPSNSGVWTNFKRQAEVSNSNAFNSYTRAMQEPGGMRLGFRKYYQVISHNMRLTRELNNIHLDEEANETQQKSVLHQEKLAETIAKCSSQFEEILLELNATSDKQLDLDFPKELPSEIPILSPAQSIYLERLAVELEKILESSGAESRK